MTFAQHCNQIFDQAIAHYHLTDDIDATAPTPYDSDTIEARLYAKCWIDTVQWHLEDIIRVPDIDPTEALAIKRRIDHSNQDRTDTVELIDTYFHTGGMEIQISVVDRQTLLNAQKEPEKYYNLVVRVSGFSAYFRSLNKTTQDEIIARTEYHGI